MQELFENINDNVKKTGELAWKLALMQKTPLKIAKFLTNVINYYKNLYTEEEIEFLRFYFHIQMEMMKQ